VRATFLPAPEGSDGVFPQVGYAIGTRCGTAVTRNTLRRRARAVVQAEAPTLPRGRFLIRLDPAAAARSREQFRADVAGALRRAGRAGVDR
jgi:ribonuclease P protein component